MRRLTPALLAVSLLLSTTACRSRTDKPSGEQAPVPAGWRVERDRDFTIAVPSDWRYKSATTSVGNEIVNFLAPKEVDGYPQGVVIGRTRDVRDQDFLPIVETFQMLQGDRTFGVRREVKVEGSKRPAVLLESKRPLVDKPITLRAWNVFVFSPSAVSLNVELLAPEQIFDEGLFNQILRSLVVKERGIVNP